MECLNIPGETDFTTNAELRHRLITGSLCIGENKDSSLYNEELLKSIYELSNIEESR